MEAICKFDEVDMQLTLAWDARRHERPPDGAAHWKKQIAPMMFKGVRGSGGVSG